MARGPNVCRQLSFEDAEWVARFGGIHGSSRREVLDKLEDAGSNDGKAFTADRRQSLGQYLEGWLAMIEHMRGTHPWSAIVSR